MVPVAPIITGTTFVFTFHMRCIAVVRSLYFRLFSAFFVVTFLSPEIATFIDIHVFLIITDHDVRFMVSDGSVGFHYYYYIIIIIIITKTLVAEPDSLTTKFPGKFLGSERDSTILR